MLVYTGGGFIPGVPARDLSEEDIKALEKHFKDKTFRIHLLNSGLYVEWKSDHRVKPNKALIPDLEDKE